MNQRVPSLRFPEFNDEWKVSPLCEVFDRVKEKNSSLNTNVLTISGQDGLVSQNKYFTKSVASKDTSGYYLLSRGDFAYNKSYSKGYPMGAIKRLKFSDSGVVSPLYICFRTNSDFNGYSEFFEHQFESGRLNKSIYRIAQEGARNHGLLNVSVNEFFIDVGISYPCNLEQNKIADFFNVIDIKISHLIAKHRLLKEYKKGVMQQIFSQKLRFRDADGEAFPEWKEKHFGDVFTRVTTKNKENNENILTISAQKGLISQLEYFNKSIAAKDVSGYYLLHKGDFAYNKSYSQGYPLGAIKPLKRYEKGVVSTLYICFRPKAQFSEAFFEQFFDAGMLNKEITKIAQEGARNHGLLNVSVKEFFDDIKLTVPDIEEQKKIAQFLQTIDFKIEGITEQIEQTKQFKKGLLQQMFV